MKVSARDSKPRIRVTPGMDLGARIKAVYEGASHGARLGSKGLVGVAGPNADITGKISTLRKRSRHAVRNNPYATTAVETYTTNLIGNGIVAKWPHPALQAAWDRWILECDADGLDNFYGLQILAARSQYESGEVLTRQRIRQSSDGLLVPLQLQLLEADHLDDAYTVQGDKNPIAMGIQFDAIGRRTGYHLWRDHPGENANGFAFNVRRMVPASDIIHLYRRLRPGQLRGVPELTPILVRLYEIDEMQDATLVKQKTAQLFGWIVKRLNRESEDSAENTITGASEAGPDGEQIERIVAGGVHYLEEGEEVDFSAPDGIGPNYAPWLKTELRASAKAAGLTYEQFTGDLEGLNFSSIRAGLLEFRRRIEQLQLHFIVHRWCRPVAKWFADVAVMSGAANVPGYWKDPGAFLPSWKPPKWDWVDPLKDVMADMLEVRAGFNTRANKITERALDADVVNDQLMVEQAMKLVLDSDPSKTSVAGQVQAVNNLINNGAKADE
jgi:lambda family phage portal protein